MGLPGRVWSSGGPVCIRDVALDPELPRAKSAAKEGLHAAFAFPVMLKSGIVGVIELFSREVRDADRGLLQMMAAIGSQVAQSIERTRAKDALRDARPPNIEKAIRTAERVVRDGNAAADDTLCRADRFLDVGRRGVEPSQAGMAVCHDCLQRLIDLMSDGGGQLGERRDLRRLRNFFSGVAQRVLRPRALYE